MNDRRGYPWATIAAAAGAFLYLSYHFRQALIPFVLSFALAYLVNPLINIFEARGFKREYVVTLLYTVIALAISISANFLFPTITTELAVLQKQAPNYYAKTQEYWALLEATISRRIPVGAGLIKHWSFQMYDPLMSHVQRLPSYLLNVFPLLSLLFLVPFISFYFLMDSSKLTRKAIQSCPSRYVEQALHLLSEVDTSLGHYVRGVMIEALAVAVASFVGLWMLDVNYALVIATIAGLASFVPYAGPLLGATAGGIIALVQFKNFWIVAKVLALFGAIRMADDMFLQPIISKYSIHLHPLFYLLALMIGAEAFGFVGLLLGVPAACILKALGRVAWDWHLSERRFSGFDSPSATHIPYV